MAGLCDAVDGITNGAIAARDTVVDAIITGLVDYLRSHPELLRLDALGHTLIERNMTPDELMMFKCGQMETLMASGGRLDQALALPQGKGT